jgi:hypothetical protein
MATGERVGDEVGAHVVGNGPADDEPGIGVHHSRAVHLKSPRHQSRRRRVHGPADISVWEHVLPGEIRGRALQDIDLDFQPTLVFPQLRELLFLAAGQSRLAATLVSVGLDQPIPQTRLEKFLSPSPTQRSVWPAHGPTQQRDDGTRQGEEAARRHPSWWPRPPQVGCPCYGGKLKPLITPQPVVVESPRSLGTVRLRCVRHPVRSDLIRLIHDQVRR